MPKRRGRSKSPSRRRSRSLSKRRSKSPTRRRSKIKSRRYSKRWGKRGDGRRVKSSRNQEDSGRFKREVFYTHNENTFKKFKTYLNKNKIPILSEDIGELLITIKITGDQLWKNDGAIFKFGTIDGSSWF